jgi:hypothetical protein
MRMHLHERLAVCTRGIQIPLGAGTGRERPNAPIVASIDSMPVLRTAVTMRNMPLVGEGSRQCKRV